MLRSRPKIEAPSLTFGYLLAAVLIFAIALTVTLHPQTPQPAHMIPYCFNGDMGVAYPCGFFPDVHQARF